MSATLSPQERDALLVELRRRTTTPGFHFLSADHIQRLNGTASEGAPVVSLFLSLGPESRAGGAWETTFKDLRAQALAGAGDGAAAVRGELDRIHDALAGGLPRTGRGVAFFACEEAGLFEQIGTAVDLQSEVHVNRTPYVRPLARVRDEHDRFAVALVSLTRSRFFFAQIGLVEEVFDLVGPDVEVTDHASKDQRQDIRDDLRRAMAQRSAHALDLIADTLGARHIVYACPPDMEASFLDALPQGTRQKVAASFSCDVRATSAEVAERAEAVQREVEAREEMETLGRVAELRTTRSVVGLEETLDMLNQMRVMTLVVNDDLRMEGGVDDTSGMLTTQTSGDNPATGGTIRREPDLFEAMLERAMLQGAELELVRSEGGKAALAQHGPAAAILRF
ncbi:MAG TPA: hypothetical protein VK610_07095 [Rhodothermales bacterium]|nr:hypothetical protein [Rhodothermales bacterium]